MTNNNKKTTPEGETIKGCNYVGLLKGYDFSKTSKTKDLDNWLNLTIDAVDNYGELILKTIENMKTTPIKIAIKKKEYLFLADSVGGLEALGETLVSVIGSYEPLNGSEYSFDVKRIFVCRV